MENVLNFNLNAVRLQHAVLCVDCNVISDSPQHNCLVCGSGSLLPLARVLDRPEQASISDVSGELEQPEVQNSVLVLASCRRNLQRHALRR